MLFFIILEYVGIIIFLGGFIVDLEMSRKLLFDRVKRQDVEEIYLSDELVQVIAYAIVNLNSYENLLRYTL